MKEVPEMPECANCQTPLRTDRHAFYRYAESGMPNVFLLGVETADCPNCDYVEVSIPRIVEVHGAIAAALLISPARLTGEQFRFLRKHLGLTGAQLGPYLHTDKTKISKWERGEDPIGPTADRLLRLLVAQLDPALHHLANGVAHNLPAISDKPGQAWVLHVDVATLRTEFLAAATAA